jgi:hypothetical protein
MNSITVNIDVEENGKANVFVTTPQGQKSLSIRESVHMLTAGISLIIKGSSQIKSGMKDYELLEEVIKHLNDDFISVKSYDDAYMRKNVMKNK